MDARIAAQRAAALAHLHILAAPILWEVRESGLPMGQDVEIWASALNAYRAIGVLNSPKEKPHA